jgi:hypothetical protein
MKKLNSTWIVICLFSLTVTGQKNKARVENMHMDFVSNRFEIRYDIVNSVPDRQHEVEFYVIDNRGGIVFPDSLRGDIGSGVKPGRNKKIIWDIYTEYDVVYGDFNPKIILDGRGKFGVKGGPSNALLSVLVPGLGDYFVEDHRKMKIKPWYRTATTYAFMGMGIASLKNRNEVPAVIGEPGYYPNYISIGEGQRIWYEEWRDDYVLEPGYTEYWLFRYDAEVFLGVGITCWLVDVIWVTRRGIRNNKIKNNIFDNLTLVPVRQGMGLSYTYNF